MGLFTRISAVSQYDILGQVKRASVPTEIDGSWNAAGDDYTRGYLWTSQEYDWKGRTKRIVPSDSNGTDGKDQLFDYEGCGCAGSQVTTVQSEVMPRDDTSGSARRVQKIHADILGRTKMTELMKWNGVTPETTTVQTYNGRDQVTNTSQYAGGTSAGHRDVTMSYDGHGRLKTRHYPIEDTGTETSWSYNADDSVSQAIDPRGVITSMTYDTNSGLTTHIAYTTPSGSLIPSAHSVDLTYDALGNRTGMTDGAGSISYEYSRLSQLTAEQRSFTDTLTSAPITGNTYRLEYTYNLSGVLQSYKDPFGKELDYTRDRLGRLTKVAGSAFGDNTTGEYVDGIQYRAFGAIKQMTYKTDDNNLAQMDYDDRLRVSAHRVSSTKTGNVAGYLQKASFSYYNDSTPQAMTNDVTHDFDRTFAYDYAGRLTANTFGTSTVTPYAQTLQYNAFSELITRNTSQWSVSSNFTSTYTNGRVDWDTYDAAGNQTLTYTRPGGDYQATTFDAAGRRRMLTMRQRDPTVTPIMKYEQT